MKALPVNAIIIDIHGILEGVVFAETSCEDYDHYRRLPQAVEFQGRVLGKSGWNSDRCVAYYRSDKAIARVV